jgi:hypothetical protein
MASWAALKKQKKEGVTIDVVSVKLAFNMVRGLRAETMLDLMVVVPVEPTS